MQIKEPKVLTEEEVKLVDLAVDIMDYAHIYGTVGQALEYINQQNRMVYRDFEVTQEAYNRGCELIDRHTHLIQYLGTHTAIFQKMNKEEVVWSAEGGGHFLGVIAGRFTDNPEDKYAIFVPELTLEMIDKTVRSILQSWITNWTADPTRGLDAIIANCGERLVSKNEPAYQKRMAWFKESHADRRYWRAMKPWERDTGDTSEDSYLTSEQEQEVLSAPNPIHAMIMTQKSRLPAIRWRNATITMYRTVEGYKLHLENVSTHLIPVAIDLLGFSGELTRQQTLDVGLLTMALDKADLNEVVPVILANPENVHVLAAWQRWAQEKRESNPNWFFDRERWNAS